MTRRLLEKIELTDQEVIQAIYDYARDHKSNGAIESRKNDGGSVDVDVVIHYQQLEGGRWEVRAAMVEAFASEGNNDGTGLRP